MPRSTLILSLARALTVAATLAMAPSVDAHKTETKHLKLVHPYIKETAAGATDAIVSMTIHNQGRTAERLIGATSSIAKSALVVGTDGAHAIEIPAGKSVDLSALAGHIRLVGLRRPATVYDRLPLSLTFAHAGLVKVEIMVEEADAAPGAASAAIKPVQPVQPVQPNGAAKTSPLGASSAAHTHP